MYNSGDGTTVTEDSNVVTHKTQTGVSGIEDSGANSGRQGARGSKRH